MKIKSSTIGIVAKAMCFRKIAASALVFTSLCSLPVAVLADSSRSFGIGVTSDDNLSRSIPGDELSSPGLAGTYSINNRRQLSDTSSLNRVYQFAAEYYSSYTGYSNASAEAQLAYHKKTGLGPNAWWWNAGGNLGYAFFSDGNRSNLYFLGDLSFGKRFGERVEFSAGYVFDTASAGDAVYSIGGHGPKAGVDFIISERWLAYANWKSRTGDSWMTQLWNGGAGVPPGTNKGGPIVEDVFSGAGDYRAYKRDTNGTETRFGANYALGDASSLDFSYMKRSVQVTGTSAWYYNNIYAISYVRNL